MIPSRTILVLNPSPILSFGEAQGADIDELRRVIPLTIKGKSSSNSAPSLARLPATRIEDLGMPKLWGVDAGVDDSTLGRALKRLRGFRVLTGNNVPHAGLVHKLIADFVFPPLSTSPSACRSSSSRDLGDPHPRRTCHFSRRLLDSQTSPPGKGAPRPRENDWGGRTCWVPAHGPRRGVSSYFG